MKNTILTILTFLLTVWAYPQECSFEIEDNPINGWGILETEEIASDFTIGVNESMSVTSAEFTMIPNQGSTVSKVYFTFYEDSGNGPGNQIGEVIIIENPTITQQDPLYEGYEYIRVAGSFDPVYLPGDISEETTYWLGVFVVSSGGFSYMGITDSFDTDNASYFFHSGLQSWIDGSNSVNGYGDFHHGIISVFGDCDQITACDFSVSVDTQEDCVEEGENFMAGITINGGNVGDEFTVSLNGEVLTTSAVAGIAFDIPEEELLAGQFYEVSVYKNEDPDCLVSKEMESPLICGYDCSVKVIDLPQNGWGNLHLREVASDFKIGANQSMNINSIEFRVAMEPNSSISGIYFTFYEDSGDGPGNQIGEAFTENLSLTMLNPIFYSFDYIKVEANFEDVFIPGDMETESTYWVGILIDYSGQFSYLGVTDVFNTDNPSYLYDSDSETWINGSLPMVGYDQYYHGIVSVYGSCGLASTCNFSVQVDVQEDCVGEDGNYMANITVTGGNEGDEFTIILDGNILTTSAVAEVAFEVPFEWLMAGEDYSVEVLRNGDEECLVVTTVESPEICEPVSECGFLVNIEVQNCMEEEDTYYTASVTITEGNEGDEYTILLDGGILTTSAVRNVAFDIPLEVLEVGQDYEVSVYKNEAPDCLMFEGIESPEICLVDCSFEIADAPVDGWGILHFMFVASDFTFDAGQYMEINSVEFSVISSPGSVITDAAFIFYEDSGNGPGEQIGEAILVDNPTVTLLDSAFDGFEYSRVEGSFDPVVIPGNLTSQSTYWIGIGIELLGDNSYLAVTDNFDTDNASYIYNLYTQTWDDGSDPINGLGDFYHGIVSVIGNCFELADCDFSVSVDVQEECAVEGESYSASLTITGGLEEEFTIVLDDQIITTSVVAGEVFEIPSEWLVGGEDYSFLVYRNTDPSCSTEVLVESPAICEYECDIEVTALVQADCVEEEGNYEATVSITGGVLGDEFTIIIGENTLTTTAMEGVVYEIPSEWLFAGEDYSVQVYRNVDIDCLAEAVIVSPEICIDNVDDCSAPYSYNTENYFTMVHFTGIGADQGITDYDFNYSSDQMTEGGYLAIETPSFIVHPEMEVQYAFGSAGSGAVYYSVWIDFDTDVCLGDDEQIIWSEGSDPVGGSHNRVLVYGHTGTQTDDGPEPIVGSLNLEDFSFVAGQSYQVRIRNSREAYPNSYGEGDGETIDFTLHVVSVEEAADILSVDSYLFAGFTYHPNPTQSRLSLTAGNTIEQVEVFNLLGQQVVQVKPNALDTILDLDRLESGVYMMRVTIEGAKKSFRIIKK